MNEPADNSLRLIDIGALESRLKKVDPTYAYLWMFGFKDYEDTLQVLIDTLEGAKVFDLAHLRKLNNHLLDADVNYSGKLAQNAHLLTPDNRPNKTEIDLIVERFKNDPDRSPFFKD